MQEEPKVKSECLDVRIFKDLTIVAYFDDPIFPYALKELVN